MKTSQTNQQTQSKNFICTIIGHRYQETRKVTNHFSEYSCKCCGKQMTEDTRGRLIQLTPELKEINATLSLLFQRRHLVNS
ncbi:hypothetical protein [Flavobacterium orientale]|uniref:Prophage protein n=1 Tax=Flavobacterium orientale TaxID=1756020 RepID=A0A917DEX9_9FLAO|nr:hypothetical protein [Flavobacterium orientale]GGD31388.1 hypothetical protein GCM10011343_21950 [Flavobacterium orientale]